MRVPGILLRPLKMLTEARDHIPDEVFEPSCGYADESALDVVPCFQSFVLL